MLGSLIYLAEQKHYLTNSRICLLLVKTENLSITGYLFWKREIWHACVPNLIWTIDLPGFLEEVRISK